MSQHEEVFKVGTDALLLGAWTNISAAGKILDIGTGTGVIALMLAQRSTAFIDAIDINSKAVELARQNFDASPWHARLSVHQKSLQTFSVEGAREYDLIVSNPPFFNRSLRSANELKNLARHTGDLPHTELLRNSAKLLTRNGRLSLILPVSEGRQIIEEAGFCELFLRRIMKVHPNEEKPPNRLLIELSKTQAEVSEDDLFLRQTSEKSMAHGFTEQYVALTREYHNIF